MIKDCPSCGKPMQKIKSPTVGALANASNKMNSDSKTWNWYCDKCKYSERIDDND